MTFGGINVISLEFQFNSDSEWMSGCLEYCCDLGIQGQNDLCVISLYIIHSSHRRDLIKASLEVLLTH